MGPHLIQFPLSNEETEGTRCIRFGVIRAVIFCRTVEQSGMSYKSLV